MIIEEYKQPQEDVEIPDSAFSIPTIPTLVEGEVWLTANIENYRVNTYFYKKGSGSLLKPNLVWVKISSNKYINIVDR